MLNVNHEVGANQTLSMIVQGDQPFVAERTMLTQKGTLVASTDSVGSSSLSSDWYFADAHTTANWTTLLSVLNPASQSVTLNVTYLKGQSGSGNSYTVPARSRATIVVNSALPNGQFGMAIHASSPVMIEEPVYLAAGNQRGGSSVVGATAPQQSWYFGAGNTSSGFNEHLILANPSAQGTNVHIRYLLSNGQVVTQNAAVAAQGRVDINVNSVVKQSLHATVISADAPILAEREDSFTTTLNGTGAVTGSSITMGSSNAHTSWYIAQGDTTAGHAETLALANPNASAAQIQVVYYVASGSPIVKTYTLAANTRMTINLSSDVGANQAVGAAIYATQPIVVEQNMFFSLSGASGGYASAGFGM